MSEESVQNYFDVREGFNLYDKRISALTDLFHQVQLDVQIKVNDVVTKMEYLKGRIDGGLSPTMQTVKTQNEELDKSVIRMEAKMIQMVGEIQKDMAVMNEHIANMDTSFQERFKEYDEVKKEIRSFVLKITLGIVLTIATTFFSMWQNVSDMRNQISSIPATIGRQKKFK